MSTTTCAKAQAIVNFIGDGIFPSWPQYLANQTRARAYNLLEVHARQVRNTDYDTASVNYIAVQNDNTQKFNTTMYDTLVSNPDQYLEIKREAQAQRNLANSKAHEEYRATVKSIDLAYKVQCAQLFLDLV